MKYLYISDKEMPKDVDDVNLSIRCTRPSFVRGLKLSGEDISIKNLLVRVLFVVITKGELTIFSAYSNDNKLLHTSYVVPKCWKFPFLINNEYEIGPCNTLPQSRGQGIYPKVLEHIIRTIGTKDTKFYMIVDNKNKSSIRGIEKAGFRRVGIVEIRGMFKQYYIKE